MQTFSFQQHITVFSKSAIESAKRCNWPSTQVLRHIESSYPTKTLKLLAISNPQGPDGEMVVEAPGGFAFHIYDKDAPKTGNIVRYSASLLNIPCLFQCFLFRPCAEGCSECL